MADRSACTDISIEREVTVLTGNRIAEMPDYSAALVVAAFSLIRTVEVLRRSAHLSLPIVDVLALMDDDLGRIDVALGQVGRAA